MTVDALEHTFAAPGIDTPLRRRLTAQLRLFVNHLAELGVRGDVWIDGSYATTKPVPRDVDAVLMASLSALTEVAPNEMARLQQYMTPGGRAEVRSKWQVDFYVANRNSSGEWDYWMDWLSRNPDQSSRKGIPFVSL